MAKQRLQKVMASAGVASRRQCEQWIVEGLVRVNGRVADELPVFVDPDTDVIMVNGKRLARPPRVYFLLNKPKGVLCTSRDPAGRVTAVDLVACQGRVFCVGRLDADTTGLIIMTNDAELTYVAKVRGYVDRDAVEKLQKGIWLAEGRTGRAVVKVLKSGRRQSLIEITIRQGLNRQVRRMLAKVGVPVESLKRTRIAGLALGGLGVGKFRPLSRAEVAALKRIATR
jgi:23S rRNA pseudouridine2605 synthase